MEGAIVVNVVGAQYNVLDCGHQGIEAEALPIIKVNLYEP